MSRRPVGHAGARCGGKNRDGSLCKHEAGWGTTHVGEGRCKTHGGSTPTHVKGATIRLVEQQARELFGKAVPEIKPIANPLEAYAEFAGEVMAWKQLMHSLLEDLAAPGHRDKVGGEQIAAAVQLYERSMDRANAVLSAYARLNIDARLATITKQQADMVMRAVEAVINHFQPAPEQADAAKAVAIRHLRAVEAA